MILIQVGIMAPSKKSQQEIRRKKRECEKRRREQIKSDPHLYEQAKAKETERYKKRKEERKILPISQISERQQRKQRKEWQSLPSLLGSSHDIPHKVPDHTMIINEEDLTSTRELIEGKWAVVKFVCKKADVFFIGQIMLLMDSKYLFKFLRKKEKAW
ncbi:hypothetical protein ACJJTC_012447 [Scirpophaga incertulas]